MFKFKLAGDSEVIESKAIHSTILVGENEHIVHLGINIDKDDYSYTIGYIDDSLSDEDMELVETYIEKHKREILDLIRKSI